MFEKMSRRCWDFVHFRVECGGKPRFADIYKPFPKEYNRLEKLRARNQMARDVKH